MIWSVSEATFQRPQAIPFFIFSRISLSGKNNHHEKIMAVTQYREIGSAELRICSLVNNKPEI
jgi:hypothetical protein